MDTWEKYGHPESEIMDSTAYGNPASWLSCWIHFPHKALLAWYNRKADSDNCKPDRASLGNCFPPQALRATPSYPAPPNEA